jgi:hypothetical protein
VLLFTAARGEGRAETIVTRGEGGWGRGLGPCSSSNKHNIAAAAAEVSGIRTVATVGV